MLGPVADRPLPGRQRARPRASSQATGRAVSPPLARKLADPQLADHPATDVTFADALAFCAWAGGAPADRRRVGGRRARGRRARRGRGATSSTRTAARASRRARAGPRRWPPTRRRRPVRRRAAGRQRVGVGGRPARRRTAGARCAAAPTSTTPGACAPAARWPPTPRAPRPPPACASRWIHHDQEDAVTQPAARPRRHHRRAARRLRPLLRRPRHQHRRHGRRGGRPRRRRPRRRRPRADHGLVPVRRVDVDAIPERLRAIDGVETVDVHIVWDPVWTPERLSDVGPRRKLDMPLEELVPYRERRLAQERSLTMATTETRPGDAGRARAQGRRRSSSTASATSSTSTPRTRSGRPASMFDEHLYAFHQFLTARARRSSRATSSCRSGASTRSTTWSSRARTPT